MSRNINQRQKSAFREIIKGTAIFGGTQMVSMLSGLVRGKFLAIILGAHGMGVSSLLASAIQPVQQFFAMGLPSAAVSSIAHATDETEQRQRATALRRSTLLLALAAAAFLIISASLLSSVTFGTDTDYTLWFAALAAAVFFNMLAACENTILQSFRQLKALALCNIVTAAAGVLISIPILYVMGIEGIVIDGQDPGLLRQIVALVGHQGEMHIAAGQIGFIKLREPGDGVADGQFVHGIFHFGGVAVMQIDAVVVTLVQYVEMEQGLDFPECVPQGKLIQSIVFKFFSFT